MPRFVYRAKRGLEEAVEGVIEAESQDAVVARLTEIGLTPIKVEEQSTASSPQPTVARLKRRISGRDITIFTQKLYSLIKARVELLSSLNILYEQADNVRLKEVIRNLRDGIKDGQTFSETLSRYPNIFSPLYMSIIESGESSGRLDEALKQISEFMERGEELRMKVRSALAYPLLMIIVGIATIFVLVSFVIPRLSFIFADLGQAMPLPTRILLKVSDFFGQGWSWIVGIIILIGLVSYWRRQTSRERILLARLKLHFPILGKIIRNQAIAHFSRTLSLLLRSGIPLFRALQVAIPTLNNPIMMQELVKVRQEVIKGSTFSTSMENLSSFPKFFTRMISVGEKGGRLEEVLSEVANAYTREVEASLKIATSLLEPLTILVLGLILGAIVMAMLLPIFQISLVAG